MSNTFTVNKLLKLLDSFSPFARAEEWDNVGLMVGDPQREVRGILLALDPTEDLLAECRANQCNTIITHHPLIFKPLPHLRPDMPPGRLIFTAIHQEINIIACHTNLDVAPEGVSDQLARRLELAKLQVLQPTAPPAANGRDGIGFGRLGELAEPVSGKDFLARLLDALELEAVPVAGPLPAMVRKVAVCGGSGSDLAPAARQAGADIYVTGEIKHAVARWAEMEEFCLVDAGHYHSENHVIDALTVRLARELAAAGHDLPVMHSRRQQSPFRLHKK
ncbi:Nif3-like dinuclear metal center hexameric protein [Desulfurivibrio dismutans]|uniref:Nif3-like dinuclear metal center hexameric protein n=1 Tax=Desulfurivibrio dismutans TaxID=1398908 RepID=UPI0023DBDD97|nr:Nif3-like dinuclear metal center hexameric protein [Desulfurivibrio alkaliphilus]MDF1614198.1 Nif3-like dinuclear metal center hexameric protein [Desulfurivibrio alkaliphilus]